MWTVVGAKAQFSRQTHHLYRHKRYRFAMWCEDPQQSYNALMDALYRPSFTDKQAVLKRSQGEFLGEVTLTINTPFRLPKSNLFIQFKRREYQGVETKDGLHHSPKYTDDIPDDYSISTHGVAEKPNGTQAVKPPPTVKDLEDGPHRYTIRFQNHHTTSCRLRVRMDLFGDQKTILPCEPLFCDSDIARDKKNETPGNEKNTAPVWADKTGNTTGKAFRWIEFVKTFTPGFGYGTWYQDSGKRWYENGGN